MLYYKYVDNSLAYCNTSDILIISLPSDAEERKGLDERSFGFTGTFAI